MVLLRNISVILLLSLFPVSVGAYSRDHSRDYGELRDVVDRTQSDLQATSGLQHGDKQRARVQHAQDDLSKLDKKLVRGKFDKGAFDHSLGALKAILDHNTLPSSGRDALMRDFSDLKAVSQRR